MNRLIAVFPILTWLPNYQRRWLRGDIFAGVTVGIMLIPQGMAYAMLAGLPPVYGLYAALLPQVVYSIFGTSRQLSVGPVAMDSLLVASGVAVLAKEGTDAYITYAIMLAMLMGIFQLFLGIARMGFITNLLAKPVIKGFTSAAALIIAFSQAKYIFGIESERSTVFFTLIRDIIYQIEAINWIPVMIAILGVITLKGIKKINSAIPASLVLVILGTLAVYLLNLDSKGVSIVGAIPSGLPGFHWPSISLDMIIDLLPLAATISVVAFMEAFSVAKALEAKRKDHKIIPNKELIALGAANFIGAMFQAYPVTGGFSRSAVNEQAGANTPLSSVFSVILIALTLLFLMPLFYFLPKAVLATIIVVAVIGLIDIAYARKLWLNNKVEFVLLLLTFLVTLNVGMVLGIVSGIIASVLVLLYNEAYPHIAILGRVQSHHEFRNVTRFSNLELWEDMLIIRVDASLTFVNIQYVVDYVEKELSKDPRINKIVLDASPISRIDATAINGLSELITALKGRNIRFIISDLIGPVRDTITRTGLLRMIDPSNVFINLDEAVNCISSGEKSKYDQYALQAHSNS